MCGNRVDQPSESPLLAFGVLTLAVLAVVLLGRGLVLLGRRGLRLHRGSDLGLHRRRGLGLHRGRGLGLHRRRDLLLGLRLSVVTAPDGKGGGRRAGDGGDGHRVLTLTGEADTGTEDGQTRNRHGYDRGTLKLTHNMTLSCPGATAWLDYQV